MTQHDGQANLDAVKAFFLALERHDVEPIEAMLAADAVEVIPLSASGSPEPWNQFTGKAAVMGYLGQIVANFSRTVLVDQRFTVPDDGGTVFMEAKGDLVQAGTGTPYHNVYVFKFTFEDGLIAYIAEYANPVTYAKLVGLQIG